MPSFINGKLLAQSGVMGEWWGGLKLVAQHAGIYIQIVTMGLAGLGAYTGLLNRGINVPFWAFALTVIVLTLAVVAVEWEMGVPSTFSAWNKQWWEHDNPLKKEIAALHKEIAELRKDRP